MAVQTFIDGTEVTSVTLEGQSTRRLNRISQASCRIPIEYAIGDVGSRLKVVVNGNIHFHGFVTTVSDEADENVGYTQYEAQDPMELWQWRPARDEPSSPDPGDMSFPTFFERLITGPQILKGILEASENTALIPTKAEGPLFLSFGDFATGGVDLSGAPVDWPMTIAEVANLLMSTGEVDIVLTPIDSGGNMAQINVYNGNYGIDRTGSVSFDFKTGNYNARGVRQVKDMSQIANKIWYYLGPRVGTTDDPAGNQHWRANVQGDDPNLAYPPGGRNSPPNSATNNPLGVMRIASQGVYGVRMDVKIFDARGDEGTVGRDLYRRLWQTESWIRAQPRQLVHITPVRGVGIGSFDIGDLISVNAGSYLRGGFSGAQRIYEYTINWDTEGVMELTELVASPTQEGL